MTELQIYISQNRIADQLVKPMQDQGLVYLTELAEETWFQAQHAVQYAEKHKQECQAPVEFASCQRGKMKKKWEMEKGAKKG